MRLNIMAAQLRGLFCSANRHYNWILAVRIVMPYCAEHCVLTANQHAGVKIHKKMSYYLKSNMVSKERRNEYNSNMTRGKFRTHLSMLCH